MAEEEKNIQGDGSQDSISFDTFLPEDEIIVIPGQQQEEQEEDDDSYVEDKLKEKLREKFKEEPGETVVDESGQVIPEEPYEEVGTASVDEDGNLVDFGPKEFGEVGEEFEGTIGEELGEGAGRIAATGSEELAEGVAAGTAEGVATGAAEGVAAGAAEGATLAVAEGGTVAATTGAETAGIGVAVGAAITAVELADVAAQIPLGFIKGTYHKVELEEFVFLVLIMFALDILCIISYVILVGFFIAPFIKFFAFLGCGFWFLLGKGTTKPFGLLMGLVKFIGCIIPFPLILTITFAFECARHNKFLQKIEGIEEKKKKTKKNVTKSVKKPSVK